MLSYPVYNEDHAHMGTLLLDDPYLDDTSLEISLFSGLVHTLIGEVIHPSTGEVIHPSTGGDVFRRLRLTLGMGQQSSVETMGNIDVVSKSERDQDEGPTEKKEGVMYVVLLLNRPGFDFEGEVLGVYTSERLAEARGFRKIQTMTQYQPIRIIPVPVNYDFDLNPKGQDV